MNPKLLITFFIYFFTPNPGYLSPGHHLEATKGTVEIVKALKARLVDTQANLKPIAASAISHVISSLEPENGCKLLRAVSSTSTCYNFNREDLSQLNPNFNRELSQLNPNFNPDFHNLPPTLTQVASALVSSLGDNKLQMRTATIASLQMIVTLGKDSSVCGPQAQAAACVVDLNLLNVLVPALGETLGSAIKTH